MNGILSIIQLTPDMTNQFLVDVLLENHGSQNQFDKDHAKALLHSIKTWIGQLIQSDPSEDNQALVKALMQGLQFYRAMYAEELPPLKRLLTEREWSTCFHRLNLSTFKLEMNDEPSYQEMIHNIGEMPELMFNCNMVLSYENRDEYHSSVTKKSSLEAPFMNQSYIICFSVLKSDVKQVFKKYASLFGQSSVPRLKDAEMGLDSEGAPVFLPQRMVTTGTTQAKDKTIETQSKNTRSTLSAGGCRCVLI